VKVGDLVRLKSPVPSGIRTTALPVTGLVVWIGRGFEQSYIKLHNKGGDMLKQHYEVISESR
jgi:hypothetical protein